jgi:hypothetical protein
MFVSGWSCVELRQTQVAGDASLSVRMVPDNKVTAISLHSHPSNPTDPLQAPSRLVVVVDVETEDGKPLPHGAAAEGLTVRVAVPHGRGGSRQAVLEAAEELEVPEGSFAYQSDLLTSAGGALLPLTHRKSTGNSP